MEEEKQQLMVEKGGGEEEEVNGRKSDEEEEKKSRLVDVIWEGTKKLWIVAGPAILTRCSRFGITIITQAFVGHVGPTHFAALALISTVLVRFANGILVRISCMHDFLFLLLFLLGEFSHESPLLCMHACSLVWQVLLRPYVARHLALVNTTCSAFTSSVHGSSSSIACSIFILPIFLFTAPLLSCLGQPHNIAAMAGFLSLLFIPIILSYVFSFTLQMYLQAQGRNIIIPYLSAFSLAIHFFLSWFTFVKLRWGVTASWLP